MSKLTATEFRVQNYRNIEDSGWIPLERVTALVGRNESGKTALLKALYKFNPATKEPYVPLKEFPRNRYTTDYEARRGAKWPVCSVRFIPSDGFKAQFALLGWQSVNSIVCTRYYDGGLSVEAEPPISDATISVAPLISAFKTFSKAVKKIQATEAASEEQTQKLREQLLGWSDSSIAAIEGCNDMREQTGLDLLATLKTEMNRHSNPQSADAIEPVVAALEALIAEAKKPLANDQLHELVAGALPVFIYFDNYGILDSAIYLPRFVSDLKQSPHDPRLRTINALFRHVGLDAEDIEELGRESVQDAQKNGQATERAIVIDRERKERRAIKLAAASSCITDHFSAWWQQSRHRIHYQADGGYFQIWISDDRRTAPIELESRSKGFQWFFSFYLVFLVESGDFHKDAVLLLDEPGTHLHPTAQQELLGFFEQLAAKNPLVYSTHSPFLIDGKHIHRVRPVTEDHSGQSHVSVGYWPTDRDTIFPLWAAAGYALVAGLLQQARSVLIEGVSDLLYLKALSQHCRAAGKTALADDILLTPCGGASKIGPLASLFLGGNVRPVVLLDGDDVGQNKHKNLTKELYKNHERAVLLLPEILGIEGAEIEDLLGEDMILSALNPCLPKKLQLNKDDRAAKGVVSQIESAAKRQGINLPQGWKPDCAQRLVVSWSQGAKDPIPNETLDLASVLFTAINNRLADSELMAGVQAGEVSKQIANG